MPYKTHWQKDGILWEFSGDVTAREIERANDEFYRDARSDSAKFQIIDASKVTSVEWSDQDISVMAAYDIGAQNVIKNLKVAYVAVDEEIVSKLEKYIDISRRLNSSWEFRGFDSMERAREWVEH